MRHNASSWIECVLNKLKQNKKKKNVIKFPRGICAKFVSYYAYNLRPNITNIRVIKFRLQFFFMIIVYVET